MKKAVFLDRDGVINKNRDDYVKSIDELEIFSFISEPIKKLRLNNFLVIVISNQSAINRKFTTHEKVQQIHQKIQDYLKQNNTIIDAFYYCPHKPDENCNCRKPKIGLLLEAIKKFDIEPKKSWFLGDMDTDMNAGKSLGCSVIKIDKNLNLEKAVEIILNNEISNKHS